MSLLRDGEGEVSPTKGVLEAYFASVAFASDGDTLGDQQALWGQETQCHTSTNNLHLFPSLRRSSSKLLTDTQALEQQGKRPGLFAPLHSAELGAEGHSTTGTQAPTLLTQPSPSSSVGKERRHSSQLALLAAAAREEVPLHRQHHQVVIP